MSKKILIFIIIVLIISAVTLVGVLNSVLFGPSQKKTPSLLPVTQMSPLPTHINPSIITYNNQKRDQLVDKIAGKKTLSSQDLDVKNKILKKFNNESTVIYKESGFMIIYLATPDIFQVEISTINYQLVKTKATEWFKTQGFSLDGICNLPVMFYLSAEVKNQLKDKDINFNPLPEGC